jgi:hypothetical protein
VKPDPIKKGNVLHKSPKSLPFIVEKLFHYILSIFQLAPPIGCQRLNDGFSLDKIKTVMGHTSTKTTQRYAQYKIEKLEDVIRGKSVHRLFIPSGELQVPEDKEKTWLGGKDSNLG